MKFYSWAKWASRYEDVWEKGGITSTLSNLGIEGAEWSASRPGRFTPEEAAPGSDWIGDRVDQWACLGFIRENLFPCPQWNPALLIVQSIC
jgi:hypothetical protein